MGSAKCATSQCVFVSGGYASVHMGTGCAGAGRAHLRRRVWKTSSAPTLGTAASIACEHTSQGAIVSRCESGCTSWVGIPRVGPPRGSYGLRVPHLFDVAGGRRGRRGAFAMLARVFNTHATYFQPRRPRPAGRNLTFFRVTVAPSARLPRPDMWRGGAARGGVVTGHGRTPGSLT